MPNRPPCDAPVRLRLLALGLLRPLGSIEAASAMTMATVKAHWGKPM
jgi:hypothetical protein